MARIRRLLFLVVILTTLCTSIYLYIDTLRRFGRIFLPHAGYPLNQDQLLARHRIRKQPELVPRILHQIFHGENMPAEWETQRQTCRQKNPEWEYKLWTKDMSRDLIETEYPWFLDTYDSFSYPIQRQDSVRYFILRHYGGIVVDLDYGCVNSLESLRPHPAFMVDHRRGSLSDEVLGAAPNHTFWVHITESIPRHSPIHIFRDLIVLYGTGRWFLTAAWDAYHADMLARDGRAAKPLTRISMPRWAGAPEWSIFSSIRGGAADTWSVDVFVFAGQHWIVAIASGLAGCVLGMYAVLRLRRRRKRRGNANHQKRYRTV